MKRFLSVLMILSVLLILVVVPVAAQSGDTTAGITGESWRDLLLMGVMLTVAFFGAPITQLFKNLLSKLFKQVIENKWALLLSMVVACGLAILEMWLSGQFEGIKLTPATFPNFAFAVFSVTQIYYNLFSKSDSGFGTKGLLKPPV